MVRPRKGIEMNPLQTTVFEIEGMTCGSCARHVDQALRGQAGVVSVAVDLRERTALVRHEPSGASVDELIEALRADGYPASVATS